MTLSRLVQMREVRDQSVAGPDSNRMSGAEQITDMERGLLFTADDVPVTFWEIALSIGMILHMSPGSSMLAFAMLTDH